ncbi:hypothetical protein CTAYLR_001580 [Chrysophaeum taylorii]|uniref:Protein DETOXIFICATION n=1 Tax=Chrysophaeum taylorii TaxID=2483200 RepID=A0AAD7UDK0_9STRA|nr:hypothetical protein CTAYLR_001580 [Chrysophaeum taylorii]
MQRLKGFVSAAWRRRGYSALPASQQQSLDSKILGIALPSLVALSLDPVLQAVDTAFVGQLASTEGLAALGVSTSAFALVFSSTNFFSNTATPLVAERKDAVLARRICVVGLVLGCALCVGLEAFAPWLVRRVGGLNEGTAALAASASFARLRALSAPAVVAANALNGCLRGLGDAVSPLNAAVLAACLNFALDCALVPRFGANGAAVATVAAETAAALFLAAVFARVDVPKAPSSEEEQASSSSSSSSSLGSFAAFSALTLSRTLSLQLFLVATTNHVGALAGADALAANHILRSLYVLLSFATDALAIAAQQLVASAQTQEEKDVVASRLLLWGLGVGIAFALALFLLADPLVYALDADPRVRALAAPLVRDLLAPLQVLSSLVFVGDGILQGSQAFAFEAVAMAVSASLAAAALSLPVVAADPYDVDRASLALDAAWRAVCVLQSSRAATFAFWWWWCRRRRRQESSTDDLSELPADSPTTNHNAGGDDDNAPRVS